MVYFGVNVAYKWRKNGVYALWKSSNFAPSNDQRKMALFGLIATGAALLNYRKAKEEHDAVQEKYDRIMGAVATMVDTYNAEKYDVNDGSITWIREHNIDEKPNDMPKDVFVSTTLRIANLVGKMMRVRTSVVIQNSGSENLWLHNVYADCNIQLGNQLIPILVYSADVLHHGGDSVPQKKHYTDPMLIAPGETIEIQFEGGLSAVPDMGALRAMICEAAGKKLITSCPKMNIEGGEKADIMIDWRYTGDPSVKRAYWMHKPGCLRYCGEAGL